MVDHISKFDKIEELQSASEGICNHCNKLFKWGDKIVQVVTGEYHPLTTSLELNENPPERGINRGVVKEYHSECFLNPEGMDEKERLFWYARNFG